MLIIMHDMHCSTVSHWLPSAVDCPLFTFSPLVLAMMIMIGPHLLVTATSSSSARAMTTVMHHATLLQAIMAGAVFAIATTTTTMVAVFLLPIILSCCNVANPSCQHDHHLILFKKKTKFSEYNYINNLLLQLKLVHGKRRTLFIIYFYLESCVRTYAS